MTEHPVQTTPMAKTRSILGAIRHAMANSLGTGFRCSTEDSSALAPNNPGSDAAINDRFTR